MAENQLYQSVVPVRVLPEDRLYKVSRIDGLVVWTPNYNGVNSYAEIPEWIPEGDFEIEFNLRVNRSARNNIILGGDHYVRSFYMNVNNTANESVFLVRIYQNGVMQAECPGTNYLKVKVTRTALTVNGVSVSCDLALDWVKGITMVGGAVSLDSRFYGQISGLRLVDKTSLSNSRFYPGIVRQYAAHGVAEVPMPESAVLIDARSHDGSTNGTLYNFGTDQPYVPLLGEREEHLGEYEGDGGYIRGISVSRASMTFAGSPRPRAGSLNGELTNEFNGSMLVGCDGLKAKIASVVMDSAFRVDKLNLSDTQLQRTFQYPNIFKIIKPTDPDYGDYA